MRTLLFIAIYKTPIKHFFTFFIYFFTYLISENRVPKKEFAHSILHTHTLSLSLPLTLSLFLFFSLSLSVTCQAIIERTDEHIYAKKGNESQNNVRRRIRTHFFAYVHFFSCDQRPSRSVEEFLEDLAWQVIKNFKSWAQFHQSFTSSFYPCGTKKCKMIRTT